MNAVAIADPISPCERVVYRGPRGGRPHGEIRLAFIAALKANGPMSLRDLAHGCKVGYAAARWTLDCMVRGGAAEIVGREKRSHSKKWVAIYDMVHEPEAPEQEMSPTEELAAALAMWCR